VGQAVELTRIAACFLHDLHGCHILDEGDVPDEIAHEPGMVHLAFGAWWQEVWSVRLDQDTLQLDVRYHVEHWTSGLPPRAMAPLSCMLLHDRVQDAATEADVHSGPLRLPLAQNSLRSREGMEHQRVMLLQLWSQDGNAVVRSLVAVLVITAMDDWRQAVADCNLDLAL